MKKPFTPETPIRFIEAVMKLGYEDFFTTEGYEQPHELQAVTLPRHNYLYQLSRAAGDIMRYACGDKGHTTSVCPEVRAYIVMKGDDVVKAFDTLFTLCKEHLRKVDNLQPDPGGARAIRPETCGITDAQAAQLKDALDVIWRAIPDADPLLIEGMEYVMETASEVQALLPNFWWRRNDRRSDYDIVKKIEDPAFNKECFHQLPASPEKRAALALQSAENISLLKPRAQEIAGEALAWCLSRTLELDADYRIFDNNRLLARHILGELDRGEKTIGDVATDIRKQRYGKLRGKRAWMKSDAARLNAEKAADGAPAWLAFALDVYKGNWFDIQCDKRTDLADRQITEAYSLAAPIKVQSPLKLKARAP